MAAASASAADGSPAASAVMAHPAASLSSRGAPAAWPAGWPLASLSEASTAADTAWPAMPGSAARSGSPPPARPRINQHVRRLTGRRRARARLRCPVPLIEDQVVAGLGAADQGAAHRLRSTGAGGQPAVSDSRAVLQTWHTPLRQDQGTRRSAARCR